MRSFAVALVSTLLLSPNSVFATYHDREDPQNLRRHDGGHSFHPKHHDREHSYSRHHEDEHLHFPAHEQNHSVSKVTSHPTKKVARIVVSIDYLESDVDNICRNKERSCYDHNGCDNNDRKCSRKNKCHEKKKDCFNEFECHNVSKKCHRKSTEKYGFRCGKKFYQQEKVLEAASAGCKAVGRKRKGIFPATHTTYEYDHEGPYFEWPATRYESISKKHRYNKHRIVITMDCAVVGAVVREKGGKYDRCRYERY